MPKWVKLLIALLLEIFKALKEPEEKGLVLRSIGAVKGTPEPNPDKAARFFRKAVATGKIPEKAQAPVWRALQNGGARSPEEEEPPEWRALQNGGARSPEEEKPPERREEEEEEGGEE